MEQSPSWQGLPPDSAEYTILLLFFVSLACVCIALFGEQMPAVYLGISAVCTLTLALCLRLQRSRRSGTGFTLDDDARMLRPHGARGPISFSSITYLRLILYRDCACLQAVTGALRRRRALACVSRPGPVQDMLDALAERGCPVRVSRNPFKKRTAEIAPLLIMPLLAVILLYVSIDMYRRFPVLAQPPQLLSVEPAPDRARQELYDVGPVALRLPRGYRLVDKQPRSIILYNPAGDIRLALDAGPDRRTIPHSRGLQAVAGMLGFGTIHDATLLAVRSRFGLMPAMIKSALLKRYDPDTVQIYRVSSGALSGVMLRGEQARPGETGLEHMPDQVAEITLRTAAKDLVIRILVASRAPLDTERIKSLISGIR